MRVAACSALTLAAIAYWRPDLRAGARPATHPAARTAAALPYRPVYPYSVVPGGVFSRQEAARAAARDRVVAAHYAGFDLRRARPARLERDWDAHVSYRIRDAVYWTRRPLRLRRGELVLTDGGSYIRARCGNRIAEKGLSPTTAEEPPAGVLDMPEPPAFAPLAADISWPPALPASPPITDVNHELFNLVPSFPVLWSAAGGGIAGGPLSGTAPALPGQPASNEPVAPAPAPAPGPAETAPIPSSQPPVEPEPGPLPISPPGPAFIPDPVVIPAPIPVPVPPGDSPRTNPSQPGSGGSNPGVNPGDDPLRPPVPPPPGVPPEYLVPSQEPPSSPPPPPLSETPEPGSLMLVAAGLALAAWRAQRSSH